MLGHLNGPPFYLVRILFPVISSNCRPDLLPYDLSPQCEFTSYLRARRLRTTCLSLATRRTRAKRWWCARGTRVSPLFGVLRRHHIHGARLCSVINSGDLRMHTGEPRPTTRTSPRVATCVQGVFLPMQR